MRRLCDALNRRHSDLAAACVVFLMLTGARRGETLLTRWRDVDLAASVWVKPSAHTETRKLHRVPLNAAARAILTTLAERFVPAGPPADAFVFGPGLIHRLRATWEAVRAEAALPGLRLHDCRHAYASVLASAGLSFR